VLTDVGLAEPESFAQIGDAEFAVTELVDDEESFGVREGLANASVELVQLSGDLLVHEPSPECS